MGFFKAYDMRGTFGSDFDLETVRRIGRALPQVIPGRRWLIGRDGRSSGAAIRDALASGLVEAGVEVTDLGLCTTPMVYFFTAVGKFDGSVMITASHNPPADNGLKVSRRDARPVGYADGLDRVERMLDDGSWASECATPGSVAPYGGDAVGEYVGWQQRHADYDAIANLRVAIDCSNGMAAILAHRLFPKATFINDTVDGAFPAHSPNPLNAESRTQLSELVRKGGFDCGVIFDGDADRAMFIDENGSFVQPDYLIPAIALASKTATPPDDSLPPRVIHDVRTSRGTIEALKENGFEPAMVPVGHAFAKPALRRLNAICGGELAGHYYFRDFFGCDSGVLAAARILDQIAAARQKGQTFSQMAAAVSGRYANSGEMNFRVEDKDAAIARVLAAAARELPAEISRETIDGLRLEYAEGWISVRKSNTEPFLRLLVECDTRDRLCAWKSLLSGAIENAR